MYKEIVNLQNKLVVLSARLKDFEKCEKDDDIYEYCDFMKKNFLQLSGNN
ncbi:hypothetical protein IJG72_06750 [bacterium]|nr:hypothetical protein [bacterium]